MIVRKLLIVFILCGLLVAGGLGTALAAANQVVTINVQNADVRDVLTMIASSAGVNMVLDDTVKGNISLNVTNMPVDQVLDLVVKTKGLAYQKMPGGSIVVADAKTLLTGFGTSSIFQLKYALADDVQKSLAGVVPPERLKVDAPSNSMIFFGSPGETEQIRNAVAVLDVPCRQVSVEAEVLEINKNASKDLGFNWSFAPAPVQSGSGEDRDYSNYGAISFGRAPDGNPYQFRFKAQLNALIQKGDAKVLARPKISTISGKQASIVIGDKIPVETQTTTNGTTATSITYLDTGIRLIYTPVIGPDGKMRAHLLAEVSTPQKAQTTDANYTIHTRTAETDLVMADGETVAVGGLISSTVGGTKGKVPFLGDLPLIGGIFRNDSTTNNSTEIVVILTARIVK